MEPEPQPDRVAEFVPPAVPPPDTAPQPPALNFHNLVAVRIALVVAPAAFLLLRLPALSVFLWVAAGFLTVFFHRRRTGDLLNVRAGVRLGWITGVIMFAITTVIFTLTVVPAFASGGMAVLRQQMQLQVKNPSDPNVQEALRLLETPPGLATFLLVMLFMLFVFITLLSMAGGALGAKFVSRSEPRP